MDVLFCGHSKTGQHWILLVIENYHRILDSNAETSITFEELHNLVRIYGGSANFTRKYITGELHLKWTEEARTPRFINLFNNFDKLIYLHRHPGDVMISMFHYYDKSLEFQEYVKNNIPKYLDHIEQTIGYADVVLCYDELRKDPSDFRKVIRLFYEEINEEVFQKALEISSFDAIHSLKDDVVVRHTCDGRSGQYKEIMNENMIEYIKNETKKRGLYKLWKW